MLSGHLSPRRNSLAAAFSALRRRRPPLPFWHLSAHRIPTLWFLYRGLLKAAKGYKHVQWRLGNLFRKNKNVNSPTKTREKLERAYEWLSLLNGTTKGINYSQALLQRYDHLLFIKRDKAAMAKLLLQEKAWLEKLQNRPILTGAIMRPTLYNPPLPRMKPQPVHISGMITSRRKARARRQEREAYWQEMIHHLEMERKNEAALFEEVQKRGFTFERLYDNFAEWMAPIKELLADIEAGYRRDIARLHLPYTPEFLKMIKQARREKIENKTRERERERRGEILPATIRRMRKGPPAHILAVMTPEEKERDRIMRMPSESGYTGRIKRKAGMKLKNDKTWRLEEGDPNRLEELRMLEEEHHALQEERTKRRTNNESEDDMPLLES